MTRAERVSAVAAEHATCRSPEQVDLAKRYLAVISYEDSSDVSDWLESFNSFKEAEQAYRAYRIWDLDSEREWDVEWVQRAVLCPRDAPHPAAA